MRTLRLITFTPTHNVYYCLLPLQGVIIDGCRINGEAADNIGFMLVPMTIATFRQILRL